jgi:hypothetical protein
MTKNNKPYLFIKTVLIVLLSIAVTFNTYASKVEIISTEKGFQLLRNGEPYYINGAGGTVKLEELKKYGGNSIRTWGIDANTDKVLEEAHKMGLSVTFGLWMGQERQGFDYSNENAVKSQLEEFRRIVRKYKDHPAILIWGVGNEMDLEYTNFDVWKHLEEICKMIKEEDPNHPTMAVTAGLDAAEIKLINKHTPSLDILGVNTYGDISYLPEAIRMYGWERPYIVAEWGPYGWWEVEKTGWGASIEETSTQKAETYKKSLDAILADKEMCLGSYTFLWGHKQEHTSTWFGLFLLTGEQTQVMDVLITGWSGKEPENRAPSIKEFQLSGKKSSDNIKIPAGTPMNASVQAHDPDGDKLKYVWQIVPESTDKKTGGDAERAPTPLKGIFNKSTREKDKVDFTSPQKPGQYRLFLFVYDGNNNVATGNIPFMVTE